MNSRKMEARDEREYVITFVHGTFARGATWTGENSRIRHALSRSLSNVSFHCFLWSGLNSHNARLAAGQELSEFLLRLRHEHPTAHHFVIAHSHGGNVAFYALQKLGSINGLVCLATPFLDCAKRDINNTIAILRFALPVFTLLFSMLIISGLVVFVSVIAEKNLFASFDLEIIVPAVIIIGALFSIIWSIFLSTKSAHFAATRLPLWLCNKAEEIYLRLRLAPLIRTKVLVATFPMDEAALWLGAFQFLSGIPYRLWRGPSSVVRRILESWRFILFMLFAFGLACVIVQDELGIPTEALFMQVGMVSYYVFLCLLQITILMILIMAVIPKFFRSHPMVFGWESLFDNLLVRISANPLPPEKTELTVYPISKVPSHRAALLRHSAIYDDEQVLAGIVDWIKQVVECTEQ